MLIIFCIFAFLMLLFALFATLLNSGVKRILCLIGTFFCAAILAIILNAEFIATLLILVYMGAIAMLFLFVIMMIGGGNEDGKSKSKSLPFSLLLVVIFFTMIAMVFLANIDIATQNSKNISIVDIGDKIYRELNTDFMYVGLILLSGLIGAILLTIRYKSSRILMRKLDTKIELVYPPIKSGVKI